MLGSNAGSNRADVGERETGTHAASRAYRDSADVGEGYAGNCRTLAFGCGSSILPRPTSISCVAEVTAARPSPRVPAHRRVAG